MSEESNIEFSKLLPQYQNKETFNWKQKKDIHGFSLH